MNELLKKIVGKSSKDIHTQQSIKEISKKIAALSEKELMSLNDNDFKSFIKHNKYSPLNGTETKKINIGYLFMSNPVIFDQMLTNNAKYKIHIEREIGQSENGATHPIDLHLISKHKDHIAAIMIKHKIVFNLDLFLDYNKLSDIANIWKKHKINLMEYLIKNHNGDFLVDDKFKNHQNTSYVISKSIKNYTQNYTLVDNLKNLIQEDVNSNKTTKQIIEIVNKVLLLGGNSQVKEILNLGDEFTIGIKPFNMILEEAIENFPNIQREMNIRNIKEKVDTVVQNKISPDDVSIPFKI